jgi:hypothetical protein
MRKLFTLTTACLLAWSVPASAQFGGRPGDVVIYAVTYNGSGAFQVSPAATNTAQNLANFKVVSLDSVPPLPSDPFPLQRQVFYSTDSETFQVGTDVENTVGLHRSFTVTTKILQFDGLTNAIGSIVGASPSLITFPKDLDVEGDIALETLRLITWFPKGPPFIVLTDHRGPLGPPELPGFLYLFTTPGLVNIPSLAPWVNFSALYPGAGWQDGVYMKLLDRDPQIGDTIEFIRIRPGKGTPVFRLTGHTHLFVLSGNATVTPAGGSTVSMNTFDYAFLPENFVVSISNPALYTEPAAP